MHLVLGGLGGGNTRHAFPSANPGEVFVIAASIPHDEEKELMQGVRDIHVKDA
jgi:hypothetical protein